MRRIYLVIAIFTTSHAIAESCLTHPWEQAAPEGTFYHDYYDRPIPRDMWALVSDKNLVYAEKLLSKRQYTKLKKTELTKLIEKQIPLKPGKSYYLVRGLRERDDSHIDVFLYKNNLMVTSGTMGEGGGVGIAPIVVLLDKDPNMVIIFCTGAI